MTEAGKANPVENRPHTVRWDMTDWERIEEAARVLGERQHLDLAPVDIIRSGARRFADEILTTKTPEAERRRQGERRSA